METKYKTSKKACQKRIDELNNVCDRCGRKLIPIETVDNSGNPTYWAGCFHGDDSEEPSGSFTNGVEKEIYNLAHKLVLRDDIYFGIKEEPENELEFEYFFQNAVSRNTGIIQRIEESKNMESNSTKQELMQRYIQKDK